MKSRKMKRIDYTQETTKDEEIVNLIDFLKINTRTRYICYV